MYIHGGADGRKPKDGWSIGSRNLEEDLSKPCLQGAPPFRAKSLMLANHKEWWAGSFPGRGKVTDKKNPPKPVTGQWSALFPEDR
jgi:hypothetical protein